jgi:hypothetical protein
MLCGLFSRERNPALGKYEVKAGWLIPAVLEQQLNSDLPGFIRALLRENVLHRAALSWEYIIRALDMVKKRCRLFGGEYGIADRLRLQLALLTSRLFAILFMLQCMPQLMDDDSTLRLYVRRLNLATQPQARSASALSCSAVSVKNAIEPLRRPQAASTLTLRQLWDPRASAPLTRCRRAL